MTARRVVGALLAVGVIGALVAPAGAAFASPASDKRKRQQQIGSQIQSLQDQVEEASAEEAALLGQIDTSRARLAELTSRVQDLDGQATAAERDLGRAQDRLVQLDQALTAARARAAALEDQRREAQVELKMQAVEAYVGSDTDVVSMLALDLRSQRDLAAAQGYTDALLNIQQNAIDRFDVLREEADDAAAQVAAARDEARRQRQLVAAKEASLQAERDQQDLLRQQAAGESAHQNQLLDEIQSKRSEFEAQLAGLQAESDQIESFLRSLPGAGTGGIVVSGRGVLSVPIAGAPITSGFGSRVHPIFHTLRMHTGIDFGAGEGTPIRAGADGTVVRAGALGGYGNATVVDHGNGLATLCGHQSRILVQEGQVVRRGEVIGLVGHTGFATGPHLHFEVRVNGTPVDPIGYL